MRRRLGVAGALLLALGAPLAACDVITGSCGDELDEEQPSTFVDGTTEDGIYRSSSWQASDWIDFPPGLSVRFEHRLAAEPRSWQAYVATSRDDDEGSNLVLAGGSEVELIAVDSEAITLRNATCVDFFVVVVALASSP